MSVLPGFVFGFGVAFGIDVTAGRFDAGGFVTTVFGLEVEASDSTRAGGSSVDELVFEFTVDDSTTEVEFVSGWLFVSTTVSVTANGVCDSSTLAAGDGVGSSIAVAAE